MGSLFHQFTVVQADPCTSRRFSAILRLRACLWIQGERGRREFWRLSSTNLSFYQCGWRSAFFWLVITLIAQPPPPPSCCQTADYLQRKNLRIISVTLKNMDGIWKALGRSDIWLFTTNLTQRRNRPSGFFSTLLRQYAKSSKKWFLSLLAVDLLIEDFYISCSCGWRRKIGENMSTT